MSIQTTLFTPSRGYYGQLAEPGAPTYCVSCVITGSAADNAVVFGNLLLRGAVENSVTPIVSASAPTPINIVGIARYEASREPGSLVGFAGVTAIRKGLVFVRVGEDVAAGGQATYGVGTAATLNVWGDTADANRVLVQGARWADAALSGSVGLLEVDFTAMPVLSGNV